MQRARIASAKSEINVTPLVDVVLVLLIIFMVMAPQLNQAENIVLPQTDGAPKKAEAETQIVVAMEKSGTIWIDSDPVPAGQFAESMAAFAGPREDTQVVIKGDAHLTFGEVKAAMLAVERAGFEDVGLIAERTVDTVAAAGVGG